MLQAIQEEKKRKVKGRDEDDRVTKKQKSGFEVGSHEITEEELGPFLYFYIPFVVSHVHFAEAYRMTRRMQQDPMANYVDGEV